MLKRLLRRLLALLALAPGMLLVTSCTPADRAAAAKVESAVAPAACALVSILAPDGSPAGLVCSDVSKALAAALLLASADARPTFDRAAGVSHGCTPRPLPLPGRDPREFVCAESFDDATIRRALDMGHAK